MSTNSKFHLHAIAACFLTLLFMGACDKKQPDDEEISIAIRGKLGLDSGLQYKQIFVHASKGVVTLSGVVDSEGQRTAAVRCAATERGVKQVVDRLALARPPAEAPEDQKEKPLPAARPRRRPRWPSPPLPVAAELPATAAPDVCLRPEAAGAPPDLPGEISSPPPKVTKAPGTTLAVRLMDTIDSGTAAVQYRLASRHLAGLKPV